jgi:hypothetical protein
VACTRVNAIAIRCKGGGVSSEEGGRAFSSGKECCKATAPTPDVVVTKLARVWYSAHHPKEYLWC